MKIRTIILVLAIMMVLFAGLCYGVSQPVQKAFDTVPGKTLNVDLKSGGAILIQGWDKRLVEVTARFRDNSASDWKIDFDKTDEGITVVSRYAGENHKRHSSPSFDIKVPSRFNLEVRTGGGSITIAGVEGEISGKTMGGELKFSRLKGTIDFKTMGGKVTLSDSDVDGKIKTMGGRVLFENVVGDVNGSSMGGSVVYKNVKPRSGKSGGKVVAISTMGGAINVSDAPYGAKVNTMGGDIHIKSAGNFIKAKTMGGDIIVDSIDGWITATTMGGRVEVVMTGDPDKGERNVTLSSMGGDISLTVPAGLAMDIDLELCFTKRSSQDYKIISDVDLQVGESGQWDSSKRKYIHGKGKTGAGTHKIKIKTVNGNIVLKEK
jgi:DUF4097 and DUF4098 domain-containing protein YvlB